jgi:hypothetical protein
MTIKELIETEIENIDETYLEELYQLILSFIQTKQQMQKQSLMSKLKDIQIDGPEDFAANHDLYAAGEKHTKAHLP